MRSGLAGTIASAELPIVLLLAPALLFPSPSRLAVLAVLPVLWFAAIAAGRRPIPATPMNAPLGLLLAMLGVSLFATYDVRFSLGKVSGVLLGVLLFWAIVRWMSTAERMRAATAVFVLMGAGLALVGLLGTAGTYKFEALESLVNRVPLVIRGVPGAESGFNPNAVAGCLVLFLPLQAVLLARPGALLPAAAGRGVVAAWFAVQAAGFALTALAALLMQSRGAWAGLAFGCVLVAALHTRATRRAALALFVLVTAAVLIAGPRALATRAVTEASPALADTIQGRLELWSRAARAIEDHPFTGMGMNTFREVMPARYPAFVLSRNTDVAHAHNHLLQAGVDLGVPGLVAYLALWTIAGGLLVSVGRRANASPHRLIAAGLGAGLIAHFVFGLTDAIPLGSKVGVLFWITLAMVAGLHRVAAPTRATPASA